MKLLKKSRQAVRYEDMDPLSHRRSPTGEKRFPARPELRPKLTAIHNPVLIDTPVGNSETKEESAVRASARNSAIVSMALGVLGLAAWLVPWVGFPLGFYGFIAGIRSRIASHLTQRLALAGMGLCAISMTLSVANLVVAAYLGSSGKNILSGIILR